MNLLSWNCKGTRTKGFTAFIKDLHREYDTSLLFLMETHASGDKARKQAKHTGLSGQYIVDSRGQAGGIWCLRDLGDWRVDIIESTDQYIHARFKWKGGNQWLVTVVYASPNCARRSILWNDLRRISGIVDEP